MNDIMAGRDWARSRGGVEHRDFARPLDSDSASSPRAMCARMPGVQLGDRDRAPSGGDQLISGHLIQAGRGVSMGNGRQTTGSVVACDHRNSGDPPPP